MREENFEINRIPAVLYGEPSDRVWLFLHGKCGRKEEGMDFAELACPKGWQVLSIDMSEHGARQGGPEKLAPWQVVPELEARGEIGTAFGETLSWRYRQYALDHPITRWDSPTAILYAGLDNLTPRRTAEAFAARFHAELTAMEGGEHWFHTPEQLAVLRRWTLTNLKEANP